MDVNDCPRINLDELAEKIRGEITLPEFLFYRSEIEDGGGFWKDRECWRVHCSACGMDALVDKEKYPKGKDLIICPRCGETVKPRKWKSRKELQKQKFSYQHFQRGAMTADLNFLNISAFAIWTALRCAGRGKAGSLMKTADLRMTNGGSANK